MTDAEAHRFAGQWIESWNSRELEQFPDLHLTLYGVYRGVDSLVVHYQSELGLLGTELFVFDDTGLVRFGVAHYAEGAAPAGAR